MRNVQDLALLDSAGGAVDDMGFSWDRGRYRPAAEFADRAEVLFPCGGATLLRRSALEEPSTIFWEKLFMYLEDVDLGMRLWTRGWRVIYEPGAITLHEHSATGSRFPFLKETACVRNRLLVMRRHVPARKLARLMPLMILWQILWACSAIIRLRPVVFRAVVVGTIQGLFAGHIEKYPKAMGDKLIQRFAVPRSRRFPKLQMARLAKRLLVD
jgi:GT2 family glycosyltransferase